MTDVEAEEWLRNLMRYDPTSCPPDDIAAVRELVDGARARAFVEAGEAVAEWASEIRRSNLNRGRVRADAEHTAQVVDRAAARIEALGKY